MVTSQDKSIPDSFTTKYESYIAFSVLQDASCFKFCNINSYNTTIYFLLHFSQDEQPWMSLCERLSERCYIIGDNVWHRPGLLKTEELTENFKTSGIVYRLENLTTITDLMECAKKMEGSLINYVFLALLARGQTSYWDGLSSVCPSSVRPSVR